MGTRYETRFEAEMESVVGTCSLPSPNPTVISPNPKWSFPEALTQHSGFTHYVYHHHHYHHDV